MMIDVANGRGYTTEKALLKGLRRFKLIPEEGKEGPNDVRYIVCRKPDGNWTAVFLVSEWLNKNGGYAGFASERGFISV